MLLESVLVIGAGTMGRGIAQWFAQRGLKVELLDSNREVVDSAISAVNNSWNKLQEKGKFTTTEVESFTTNLTATTWESFNKDTHLVVEAIVENLDIKNSVFKKLDELCSAKTILASNTSSIPISSMAKSLSATRREKFLGLHFFNPATIMPQVEEE